MPVESDLDCQTWDRRLVAIKRGLTSEAVERLRLADPLRLAEKILAAAGLDGDARPDARTNDADARIARQTSSRTLSEPRRILQAQGAYYVATGVWAVVDRRGFETVSGRKTDYWLVRTVGLLAATTLVMPPSTRSWQGWRCADRSRSPRSHPEAPRRCPPVRSEAVVLDDLARLDPPAPLPRRNLPAFDESTVPLQVILDLTFVRAEERSVRPGRGSSDGRL